MCTKLTEDNINTGQARSQGAIGAFIPPKITKHYIAILTFAEYFNE